MIFALELHNKTGSTVETAIKAVYSSSDLNDVGTPASDLMIKENDGSSGIRLAPSATMEEEFKVRGRAFAEGHHHQTVYFTLALMAGDEWIFVRDKAEVVVTE